ncbi:MAG: phage major capsid protein, partial [Oscillospiraceae bacterium]|nr:phage major capsid protein [Oscillospiraceae bacterium]
MNQILELREKRAKAWDAAKAFLDSKRGSDGMLSAEDAATYDRMEADVVNLGKEIERMEAMEAMDKELSKPVNTPLTSKPMTVEKREVKTGRESDEYTGAVEDYIRSNCKRVSNVLREGEDSEGGYLVPVEFDRRLIDVMEMENIMRKLAHKITTSGEHKINIAASKPAASWIEEGEPLSFGDATFDQILLDAHKLHVAIKVTEELLYDNAYDLMGFIIDSSGMALARAEEDAFLNGNGVGRPTGIFAENGGGHVAAQLTAALKSD